MRRARSPRCGTRASRREATQVSGNVPLNGRSYLSAIPSGSRPVRYVRRYRTGAKGAPVRRECDTVRHFEVMPHLDIAPSKWDTSVGALKVHIADARRFLGHNLAAIGERSGDCDLPSRRRPYVV